MSELALKAFATLITQGPRPLQEDHLLLREERGIFAIADGFGGGTAGPQAARVACESVIEFLDKEAGDLDATLPFVIRKYFSLAGNVLFNAILHSNRKVKNLNKGAIGNQKGGASLLSAFLDGSFLAIAHVGACSGWLIRDGKMERLTVPRTYGRLLDPMADDEAAKLAVPLMAVGMSEDLEPEILEYQLQPGDWVLLHTDGFTREGRDGVLDVAFATQRLGDPEFAAEAVRERLKEFRPIENATAALLIF
jgi:serine/threonine protein phosphatase PrpC